MFFYEAIGTFVILIKILKKLFSMEKKRKAVLMLQGGQTYVKMGGRFAMFIFLILSKFFFRFFFQIFQLIRIF